MSAIPHLDHILKKSDIIPKLQPDHKLLFKKRQFFNENWTDPDLVHMEYIQVREDVLRNRYVLDEPQWLELSAIDLFVTYGDPDPSKHTAGFLTFYPFLSCVTSLLYLEVQNF